MKRKENKRNLSTNIVSISYLANVVTNQCIVVTSCIGNGSFQSDKTEWFYSETLKIRYI